MAKIEFCGTKVTFLVDTGAIIKVIDEETLFKIGDFEEKENFLK